MKFKYIVFCTATILFTLRINFVHSNESQIPKENKIKFSHSKLMNLGMPVNSKSNEFSPTLSPDGSFMIFNSNKHGKYQDLYISYYQEGRWKNPQPMTDLNSAYNDETPYLSYDGTMLVFASDRDGSLETPKDENGKIRVSFDIYVSFFQNNKWTLPVSIPGEVNSFLHERAPTLSKDGKTLFFNRWEFGKSELTALLSSKLVNGKFTKPQLLPKPFNMGYSDRALIEAEQKNGFFYSSNRPDTHGGWDIFFVAFNNQEFSEPENLGRFINTEENEIYLSRIDQRYFLCSNRKDSIGLFDIYSFYMFQKEQKFETRAIYFDFNSEKIKLESYEYLNALVDFLNKNSELSLEIIGHTDLNGSDEFNDKLSVNRALSVKNYLTQKGISEKRLETSGKGKREPIINKKGENFDTLNRRTEFKILD
ncbi:MAG: OmpA family protein [Spirochaetia bacterium]|nr:OmpA family protein [Spirochaetia bacterium]